jgi:hypothetical protein
LNFVKQISPKNKSDGIFGNYIGVQEPEKLLRILKFDILRVPPMQIPSKKGKNLEFCLKKIIVEKKKCISYYQYVASLHAPN